MLNAIIDWSLRNRLLVILGAAGIVVAGLLAFRRLPIDAFPDTTSVQVQINTVAPALAPLEIERQATAPIEQAISGLPGSRGPLDLAVRIVPGHGGLRGRHRHLSRSAGRERAPPERGAAAGDRATQLGPVATGLGEVFHYIVKSGDQEPWRAANDPRLDDQAAAPFGGGRRRGERLGWRRAADRDRDRSQQAPEVRLTLAGVAEALELNNANVGGGTLDEAGNRV
jgi:cobalt-zinc-cadmium resistance protein CzcA